MKNIVYSLNQEEVIELQLKLKDHLVDTKIYHVKATYQIFDTKIYIYNSNKIVLQGKSTKVVASKFFDKYEMINQPAKSESEQKYYNLKNFNTIGSDEVGVGDFFGGLIVCAAYLKKENIEAVKALGVKDSKKLTDAQMLRMYPELIKLVTYEIRHLSPKQYNKMYEQYQNSHILKAYLHHHAITSLAYRIEEPFKVIIDQFASKDNYYKYLRSLNLERTDIDIFATQAESHYDAVACASIIARVEWIRQMTNLSKKIDINLPFGASDIKVIVAANAVLMEYGEAFLRKIAKEHFKTMDDLLIAKK